MRLGDFLKYESIVIQCHNNPDPDALASGFAVWKYLTRNGKKPVFVYGGREAVSKPNLLLMIRLFGIPVHHVKDQAEIIDLLQREREETDVLPAAGQKPDLLIMTDCQYGESNTQKFEAGMVAVIDHHEVVDPAALPEMHLVMENYGSCATVVYGMLREEGYDFSSDGELQTALFYGLYTDTVRLQELWHPADKDMWDELDADDSSIKKLKTRTSTKRTWSPSEMPCSAEESRRNITTALSRRRPGIRTSWGLSATRFLKWIPSMSASPTLICRAA